MKILELEFVSGKKIIINISDWFVYFVLGFICSYIIFNVIH